MTEAKCHSKTRFQVLRNMKSLSKQQKQSLETLLWNPAIQTLPKSPLPTPDSPFHCSHAPAHHRSQFILQTLTPRQQNHLLPSHGSATDTKVTTSLRFQLAIQTQLIALLFRFCCYCLYSAAAMFSSTSLLRWANVQQVLPNDVQQNTDTIKRLSDPRACK